MINTYKIANHSFLLRTNFEYVHNICKQWENDETPEFVIECSKLELTKEEELFKATYPNVIYNKGFLESRVIHSKLTMALLDYDCFLLHGSSLSYKGQGVIFTAPSGTGKSTHAKLWRECFGDEVKMINDDLPFISVIDDSVQIHGTPWMGKHRLGNNISVNLKSIVLLNRGIENTITAISSKEIFGQLLKQTLLYKDINVRTKSMRLLEKIVSKVDLYRLECNMEISAAKICCDKIFS